MPGLCVRTRPVRAKRTTRSVSCVPGSSSQMGECQGPKPLRRAGAGSSIRANVPAHLFQGGHAKESMQVSRAASVPGLFAGDATTKRKPESGG